MLVSEKKSGGTVVRIYDDYLEKEPEEILDRLSAIVSNAYYRRLRETDETAE